MMRDIVRPGIPLPPEKRLRRAIEGGGMVLDVLLELGVQIAFAVTHVRPRLVSSREQAGRALGVQGATAVLELEEIMHLGSGEAVQHSSDLFAPGGIDLQVRRNLEVAAPGAARAAPSRAAEHGGTGRARDSPDAGGAARRQHRRQAIPWRPRCSTPRPSPPCPATSSPPAHPSGTWPAAPGTSPPTSAPRSSRSRPTPPTCWP